MISGYLSAVQNHGNLLSHLYVRRSCDDLGYFAAQIYLTDHQLVCVRMAVNL